MIDLHLHTTASDGWLSPAQLVTRAAAAGLTTISVTDHDTVAAIEEVTTRAHVAGIRVVPGIEITSVDEGRDVHVLGYFFDAASTVLGRFLEEQRANRVSRLREIGVRLAALGLPVDIDELLLSAAERPGSSVGRPQLARALVAAGHVRSVQEAFDRWLATGQPAFVIRRGPSPADVIRLLHDVGGVASLAHPAVTNRDELIEPLAAIGLDAVEAYHSDHALETQHKYLALARRLRLAVTGGSDFHGEDPSAPSRPQRAVLGVAVLPAEAFAALEACARPRRPAPP